MIRGPGQRFRGLFFLRPGQRLAPRRGEGLHLSDGGEDEAVKSGLFSNPIEFEGIKTRVADATAFALHILGARPRLPSLDFQKHT